MSSPGSDLLSSRGETGDQLLTRAEIPDFGPALPGTGVSRQWGGGMSHHASGKRDKNPERTKKLLLHPTGVFLISFPIYSIGH